MLERIATHHEPMHDRTAEGARLIALADLLPAVARRRYEISGAWYDRVLDLTYTRMLETPQGERRLDFLVTQLRRAWMATAHEYAGVTFRSPLAEERTVLPSSATIAYSYERSIECSPLDARLPAYRPAPAGWAARHLLFSSGMAALSGIMQSLRDPAVARRRETASLLVAAAYFETLDLVRLGTHGCRARTVRDEAAFSAACAEHAPDVAFIEPIVYDSFLRPFDVRRVARELAALRRPPVLVIDSTLVGPSLPLAHILGEARSLPLVVHASSGLKLDQAGLELANVGIVSLYAPVSRSAELAAAADCLGAVQRLNGTALSVDSVALLDVPFFLDPAAFGDHCAAVFTHNARLAHAVPAGGLFETVAHPSLDPRGFPWAQAPFVFFHLRDDQPARYRDLERLVGELGAARGLALERGASFGFRGHRCESIVLERAERNGVLKIALGARSGPSLEGIVALMAEIAAFPTVAAARDALTASTRPR